MTEEEWEEEKKERDIAAVAGIAARIKEAKAENLRQNRERKKLRDAKKKKKQKKKLQGEIVDEDEEEEEEDLSEEEETEEEKKEQKRKRGRKQKETILNTGKGKGKAKIKALADIRPIAVDDADSIISAFHRGIKLGKEIDLLPNMTAEEKAVLAKKEAEIDIPEKRALAAEAIPLQG